jgi:anti-anti-sigma regulatory factor
MAARTRSRPEARRIALGEDLRIGSARAAYQSLIAAADSGTLEIDATKVARVDAAGLQALAAGVAALHAKGVKCRWSEVSGALSGAAALAGLGPALGLE